MDFVKKEWVNVPDPSQLTEEELNQLPRFDADNMNRIEDGIEEATEILQNLDLTYAAKIQTGSYVGTGVCGENNKNSLTFDFTPKMVILFRHTKSEGTNNTVYGSNNAIYYWGSQSFVCKLTTGDDTNIVNISGNKMRWYNKDSATAQFNDTNYTNGPFSYDIKFSYVAIG